MANDSNNIKRKPPVISCWKFRSRNIKAKQFKSLWEKVNKGSKQDCQNQLRLSMPGRDTA